ncbi:MFS transporter [Paenarthrobacter sp. DKR-5]|uniref:MFS transporter n=1 Tax=Paenarthrobacter sp. DKR-5 TaxID=2835535 RepID=UPI001BDC17C7|nr:MFS transporter [Paenarthrobacter sp. DKR-5]MBT1004276.1 MFS transporter [Paenarthrobacter sp. DKR-5]
MRGWKGVFGALFVCSWAGNQFSPLLLMYENTRGYDAVTVNAFLGVYVLGLVPALLLAGVLSDRYGRKPVMTAGVLFALLASAVLSLGAVGTAPIYAGRLLSGMAVGTAMAVGSTWLKELSQPPFDPAADRGSGARRASLAFTLGSGLGALLAGALAQWGPLPEVLPFLLHLVVALPFVVVVRRIEETGGTSREPLREQLRVRSIAHKRFRRVVLVTAPWIFGAAALAYGYTPVLLKAQTQGFGIAYATLLTVVSLGVAAVVQPVAKRLDSVSSARGITFALLVLTASVACIGLAVATASVWFGIVSAALSGAGIGTALSTGLLEVQRIAGTRDLAGLTGAFYAAAYAGFLLPTLMAAMTPPFTSAQLFAALVLLALVSTAVVVRNFRKHLPAVSAAG